MDSLVILHTISDCILTKEVSLQFSLEYRTISSPTNQWGKALGWSLDSPTLLTYEMFSIVSEPSLMEGLAADWHIHRT